MNVILFTVFFFVFKTVSADKDWNNVTDVLVQHLRTLSEIDPMDIKDSEHKVSFLTVQFYNGKIEGLSKAERLGNCNVTHDGKKKTTVTCRLGYNDLCSKTNFKLGDMDFGKQTFVTARVGNATAEVALHFETKSREKPDGFSTFIILEGVVLDYTGPKENNKSSAITRKIQEQFESVTKKEIMEDIKNIITPRIIALVAKTIDRGGP